MSNRVGDNLKRIRKERGLTQKDLAEKIGYSSQQAVARLENSDFAPRIETTERIADKLGVDIFELLADDEDRNKVNEFDNIKAPGVATAYAKELYKQRFVEGYKDGQREAELIVFFRTLNDNGQQEALKRIRELTEIKRYTEQPEVTP